MSLTFQVKVEGVGVAWPWWVVGCFMDSDVIESILNQNPSLRKQRGKLESMVRGAYCLHRSWGVGLIRAYQTDTQKLLIDFKDKSGHLMDPIFCVKHLEILDEKSVLARYYKDSKGVEELAKSKPAELVIQFLGELPHHAAMSTVLENMLVRVVGEASFKPWWTKVKRILLKDSRVQTPARKTDPYVLRDEPVKLEEEILEDFYVMKQPKRKILLAEKLYQFSDNVREIEKDLPNIFDHLTEAVRSSIGLTQAERLHGIWVRNDLARHLHEDPEQIDPTSKSIVMETEDINQLASEIPASYQKRLLDLISRTWPKAWQQVLVEVLRTSSGKMTAECIHFFMERDCQALVRDYLVRWLNDQNLDGPLIQWIVKNRASSRFSELLEGLVGPRLLSNMLYAIDTETLRSVTSRRIPLADLVSEDQSLIAEMLESASEEEAKDLGHALLLNQGFEDLVKRSLLVRFIRCFPALQALLDGNAEQASEEIIVSKESLNRYRAEHQALVEDKIPENKKAIEVAREHGDLRENSEYKMARQDQEILLARKAQLEKDLDLARPTDFSEAEKDSITIGSVVDLEDESGEHERYVILGAWDGNPRENIVSYQTPLARSLLGKKVGDNVSTDIDGHVVKRVVKRIRRWVDLGRNPKLS